MLPNMINNVPIPASIYGSIPTSASNYLSYITLGRIHSLNSAKMTANVYILDTSSVINDIPICFPSRNSNCGSYFMPSQGEICLVAITNKGKHYVITGASVPGEQEVDEFLLEGENLIQSSGGSYLKQDILGNNFLLSAFGNGVFITKDGVNSYYSTGSQEITMASKRINGITTNTNHIVTRTQDTVKMIEYEEYSSNVVLPKVYAAQDIILNDGQFSINQTVKNSIVNDALSMIDKIDLFYNEIERFQNEIKDASLTADQIALKVSELNTILYNNYGVGKTAMLIVEKGNALNKSINNISDISNLVETDFAKSQEGADIYFRITLKNPLTGENNASVYLDAAGNMHFDCKKFIVDAEDFIFNEKPVD